LSAHERGGPPAIAVIGGGFSGVAVAARFWEATAVPQLRQHAAHLAQRLLP